ncbi:MAG: protein kinase [Verrucomicrobiae bacterium]|nr:protein kinase [Verrucomicrobiae bacterium]
MKKLADLSRGVALGERFRLLEILGRGSYGDVWLADVIDDDGKLPKQVAIKVYTHQDRAREALFREGKFALKFVHDRLVKVFGFGPIDGLVIMWMEYVPGKTMLDSIGEDDAPKPLSLETILGWLHDIASGLAYLHVQEPSCVHGDLKLDNILIDQNEGGARLTDFGQSRTMENQFVSTVGAGGILYLAPEVFGQLDGKGTRCVESDIYAFGVVAYRLLSGRFPQRNYQEVVNRIPYPRPKDVNSSIPEGLDAIIWKCLQRRPRDRYNTGAELLAALELLKTELAKEKPAPIEVPVGEPQDRRTPAEELAAIAGEDLKQGKEEAVVERLEKAIQHMSTSPKVLLVYAEAAMRLNKLDVARAVYLRLIHWMESNGWKDGDQREAHEGLAEVSVRLKSYEDAVKNFEWLIERWSEKRWYRYRLGVAYGLAARFDKSIEALQPLQDEEPSALICSKIGFANFQKGNIELACQYFNEALMLDDCEPIALFHLAQIRAAQGRVDKAHKYLDRLRCIEGADDQVASLERLLGASVVKSTHST